MNLVIDSNGSGDRKGGAGSRNGGSGGRRGGSGSRPIIYHIVAVLVLMGLLLSVVTLIVAIASGGGWPSIAGMLATLSLRLPADRRMEGLNCTPRQGHGPIPDPLFLDIEFRDFVSDPSFWTTDFVISSCSPYFGHHIPRAPHLWTHNFG